MFSRRRFLQCAASTGVVLGAGRTVAEIQPDTEKLPSAIARLKSRKAQAKPITGAERHERLDKARQLMAKGHIDAMVVSSGTSLTYFSGVRWWPSERFFAMVLPGRGDGFFVCPKFEEARAVGQISAGPFGKSAPVLTWEEDDNPYALLAAALRDRRVATGPIGIEETVPFVFSDGLAKAAPALKFVSATAVTAGCRMVKSSHELELMRLANKVTLTAYAAAHTSLKPGMTGRQFEELVRAAHRQLGFPNADVFVMVGKYTANPHGAIEEQVIREGAVVWIDGGCTVEGYQSDITRSFVLGKATDKMNSAFDIIHRAQQAALKAAQVGRPCGSVDDAARKLIADAGYGPGYKFFGHRLGHGIGLDGHEWPYLVHGNELPLEAGMTFSDEPGIYIPDEFGIRLEDDMVITERGAEPMTPQSESLEKPFEGVAIA
ncbi:MAG: Xaa-Pro peptidase family protein [Terriglobia bacterium]|nr:Xaa-Pro peptidase family protein [Terriglobia bacterium]